MSIDNSNYLDPDLHLWPEELPDVCYAIEDLLEDYESYWHFYRSIYKASCGLSIGFLMEVGGDEFGPTYGWVYCDELPRHKDASAFGVSVSSIVEGADFDVEGDKITEHFKPEEFWQLCEDVCKEVDFYWKQVNSTYFTLEKDGKTEYFQWVDCDDKPEGTIDIDDLIDDLRALSDVLFDLYRDDTVEFEGYTVKREEPEIMLYY